MERKTHTSMYELSLISFPQFSIERILRLYLILVPIPFPMESFPLLSSNMSIREGRFKSLMTYIEKWKTIAYTDTTRETLLDYLCSDLAFFSPILWTYRRWNMDVMLEMAKRAMREGWIDVLNLMWDGVTAEKFTEEGKEFYRWKKNGKMIGLKDWFDYYPPSTFNFGHSLVHEAFSSPVESVEWLWERVNYNFLKIVRSNLKDKKPPFDVDDFFDWRDACPGNCLFHSASLHEGLLLACYGYVCTPSHRSKYLSLHPEDREGKEIDKKMEGDILTLNVDEDILRKIIHVGGPYMKYVGWGDIHMTYKRRPGDIFTFIPHEDGGYETILRTEVDIEGLSRMKGIRDRLFHDNYIIGRREEYTILWGHFLSHRGRDDMSNMANLILKRKCTITALCFDTLFVNHRDGYEKIVDTCDIGRVLIFLSSISDPKYLDHMISYRGIKSEVKKGGGCKGGKGRRGEVRGRRKKEKEEKDKRITISFLLNTVISASTTPQVFEWTLQRYNESHSGYIKDRVWQLLSTSHIFNENPPLSIKMVQYVPMIRDMAPLLVPGAGMSLLEVALGKCIQKWDEIFPISLQNNFDWEKVAMCKIRLYPEFMKITGYLGKKSQRKDSD